MNREHHWKITRDSFYFKLWQRHGLAYIQEIGFFFDNHSENIALQDTLNLLCTPLSFPSKKITSGKTCVLLSTGAFCPAHSGHIEIMEKAKQALESQGWTILAGYLSPGHDEYIGNKCKEDLIPISQRIKLLQDKIANVSWLRVDPWEGVFNRVAVNLTDVVSRLQSYIALHTQLKVPVFYVCGADNARFAATFAEEGHCVVVGRPGFEQEFERYRPLQNNSVLFVHGENSLSSSAIRAEQYFIAPNKKPLYLRSNNDPREARLIEILQPYFSDISLCDNAEHIERLTSERLTFEGPIISLDANVRAQFNLNISREFDIFGISNPSYNARAGSAPLNQQCAAIPPGDYTLFDGDIHTGGTLRFAKALLQPNGCNIIDSKAFINAGECAPANCEILDASDFFIEGGTGLTIRLTSDKVFSAPYLYPYVDPFTRCSISQPMHFSIAVWKMNMDFLAKKNILLAESQHRALFEYIGFNSSDSLYDLCRWHYESLKDVNNV